MTDQVTNIGIGVDSTSVKSANAALDQMAAAGAKSEASIAALITAAREFTIGLREGANQALADYRAQNELAAKAAKTMQDETAAAGKAVKLASEAMQSAIGGFVTKFISGAAVVAAVNAEFQQFSRQIDSLAKLDDAAQAIGETIEKLSVLEGVAKVTGFSFGSVESALARLTKGLAGSDDETKGAAYALKQLGIESRDSEGKIRSVVDITKEVAIALSAAGDEANKTAYAQAIYGRGAAALIPYLNDLGKANLEGAVATKQQAEAATAFRDAQGALALESEKLRNIIAGSVLPVFTQVIEALTESKKSAGSLQSQIKALADDGSLRQWAQNAVIGVGYVIDAARGVVVAFKLAGTFLAALAVEAVTAGEAMYNTAVAIANVGNGAQAASSFAKARDAVGQLGQGAKAAQEDFDALANAFSSGSYAEKIKDAFGPNLAVNLRAFNNEMEKTPSALAKLESSADKPKKALKEAQDVYGQLIARINDQITAENAQLESGVKLTAGQRFSLSVLKELTDSKKKFNDQQKIAVTKMLEGLLVTEKENKEATETKRINEGLAKLGKEQLDLDLKLIASARAKTQSIVDENEKLKEQINTFGMTDRQIAELNLTKLESKRDTVEAALATGLLTEADQIASEEIKKQIALLKERIGLLASKDIAENAKKARDEMVATWKGVGNDITEYIMGGFKNTRDLLKKLFADLILRPTIQPIGNALAGGLQNILFGGGGGSGASALSGLFGGSSGGGGGGILGNLLGGLGNTLGSGLASAFGMNLSAGFSGLFGGASQLVSGTLGGMAELGLGFTEAFGGAVSALGGFGAALGAAIPVIGAIVAFASALGVFDNPTGIKIDNSVKDGNSRKDIIASKLGAFDVSGDLGNDVFAPLIKTVNQLDDYIAANLLTDETLAIVQANIQAISSDITDWFGYEDEAGAKVAIEKASKVFLQQRYSVAFDEIDTSVAQMIRTFSGSADELIAFITKATQSKAIIDALAESIPDLNLSLGAFLTLTEQQQKDIATIATVMPLFGQDIAQLAADAYEAQTGGIVNAFIKQGDALDDLMDKYNDGKASITDLANATVAFGQSAIQVIASLAAAKAQIDNDIAGGIRSIETTGLSPEELNRYLSNEAEALRAQLQVTTDPAKIADLVAQIIANSTQVFSGLTPEEQAARRSEFVSGLTTLNKEADDRIKTLNEIILANTKTTFDAAKEGFDAAIKEFNAGAATTAAAADKLDGAADKITDTFARGLEVSFNVVDRTVSAVGGLN